MISKKKTVQVLLNRFFSSVLAAALFEEGDCPEDNAGHCHEERGANAKFYDVSCRSVLKLGRCRESTGADVVRLIYSGIHCMHG